MTTPPRHKYLDPADMARLRFITFAPRHPVDGLYAGKHRSPQRGHSIEFVDYRAYQPGDEISDIDWKVYGRSDRLFIKLFQKTSDMTVHLLLDASASMGYAGHLAGLKTSASRTTKFDHAARLAAAIAFLVSRQQDRFSFAIARHGLRHFHPPGSAAPHLAAVLHTLDRLQLGEQAHLAQAIDQLTARVGRRGVLIVISDLLDDPAPALAALSAFTARGGEAIVFQILHDDELNLPDVPVALFRDSETAQTITLDMADVRQDYRARIDRYLGELRANCLARGFDHNLITTAQPPFDVLQRYLLSRT
jgi:uncharacterized protein (DUF58 family)